MSDPRAFVVKWYRSWPGQLDSLASWFRDQVIPFFPHHGIEVFGFWVARDCDDPTSGTLLYMCVHESREAADAAWASFRADPEWQRVKAESSQDGPLSATGEGLDLDPTDFSPLR